MQKIFAIATDNNLLPIVQTGVTIEEAKRNTLLFILVMTVFLIVLVGIGYWLEGRKKVNTVKFLIPLFLILTSTIFMVPSQAFCPVCTIAVGAGLSFTKVLGIDDIIASIWIGGVLLSSSLWLINWLDSKNIRFFLKRKIVYLVMYGFVIIPFLTGGTIGAGHNRLWGIDKLILGMTIGTLGFIFGMFLNNKLMAKNNNKASFPFQKVVFPIGILIILSLIFFFIVY